MSEVYPIWLADRVIGHVTEATVRTGQFFWTTETGGMGYAPTLDEAAKAAKKRHKQDERDRMRRLSAQILSTYNTRKKAKKRFAKPGTRV